MARDAAFWVNLRVDGAALDDALTKSGLRGKKRLEKCVRDVVASLSLEGAFRSPSVNASDYLWGSAASSHPVLQLFFRALVSAEHEFCFLDLPKASHEERLTGHILSKMHASLTFCAEAIRAEGTRLYGIPVDVKFRYSDLSTGNREKITGSDFGLVASVDLPDRGKRVAAAVFQAKKLKADAYVPEEQVVAQTKFAGRRGAFCCLYDVEDSKPLPPAVLSTRTVANCRKTGTNQHVVSRTLTEESGEPLSLFILRMLEVDGHGQEFDDLGEAKQYLLRGFDGAPPEAYPGPSRVLVIHVGSAAQHPNLGFEREVTEDRERQ